MTTFSQHDDSGVIERERFDATRTHAIAVPSQRVPEAAPAPDGGENVYSASRQYDRFGGLNWGAGFFGALVAGSLALLLGGALAAILLASGTGSAVGGGSSDRALLMGGAGILLGLLVTAFYAGGYVAGRMSRFDGGRQGFGVFLIGLVLAALAAGGGLLAEAELNLLDGLDVDVVTRLLGAPPLWVVSIGTALLLGSLLAAVAGGKVGCHYHRKVDDAGYL